VKVISAGKQPVAGKQQAGFLPGLFGFAEKSAGWRLQSLLNPWRSTNSSGVTT